MPTEVDEGKSTRVPLFTPLPVAEEMSTAPPPPGAPLLTPLEETVLPAALPRACLNCAAPLTGPFCSQCGQNVADYHRSIWRLIASFFDNVFSWDSKFFRTLGPLLTRPGLLTREFLIGRRARYVQPLRLFLFTSAVCLTLLQFGHRKVIRADSGTGKGAPAKDGVHFNVGTNADDDDDDRPSPSPAPSPSPTGEALPAAPASSPAASPDASPVPSPSPAGTASEGRRRDSADNAFEQYMEKASKRVDEKSKQLGPKEFNRQVSARMQSSLSWVALAILPVFALLVRSLYWRRDSFYFDHLIFSLHYHTFLLLLMTVYRTLDGLLDWTHLGWLKVPLAFGLLVPPWYLYRSLKLLFGESRPRTWTKVCVIGGLHLVALIIGMTIVGLTSVFSLV